MFDHSTIEMLRGMNLTAFAAELERQMSDSSFSQITFEERLGLLVDREWNRRRNDKLNRLIKKAAFSAPKATVEGIEYIEDRHLDKKQILRFAACNYIDEGHHNILKGASGNGKTYLACALGNAACRKFKSVRYIRTPELLDELSIAKADGEMKSTIKAYAKLDLLILDEWLIRRLSYNEAYDLLEIVEARRERSMIFCTQYETEGWYGRIKYRYPEYRSLRRILYQTCPSVDSVHQPKQRMGCGISGTCSALYTRLNFTDSGS